MEQARAPMGLRKDIHIEKILKIPKYLINGVKFIIDLLIKTILIIFIMILFLSIRMFSTI